MVLGQLVLIATGPIQTFVIMSGRERVAASISAGAAVLNLILNYVLIPVYGIEGAAIATSVSLAVSNLILFAYVRSVWAKET